MSYKRHILSLLVSNTSIVSARFKTSQSLDQGRRPCPPSYSSSNRYIWLKFISLAESETRSALTFKVNVQGGTFPISIHLTYLSQRNWEYFTNNVTALLRVPSISESIQSIITSHMWNFLQWVWRWLLSARWKKSVLLSDMLCNSSTSEDYSISIWWIFNYSSGFSLYPISKPWFTNGPEGSHVFCALLLCKGQYTPPKDLTRLSNGLTDLISIKAPSQMRFRLA